MSPDPELLERARKIDQELARKRATTHPLLDKLVAGLLIVGWLVVGAGDTYGPLWLFPWIWAAQALALFWLYRQYREHSRPSMFDQPRPATRPDIPLMVRLCLLPGAHHVVGHSNVAKARRIRFMRTDMARRAEIEHWHTFSRATGTIPTDHRGFEQRRMNLGQPPRSSWERSMHNWAGRNPGQCSNTVHLFDQPNHGRERCRCGAWYWSSLNDVRTLA